jgi:surface protein
MAIDINKDISYQLSINVLKALGGDTSKDFQSVEEVWDEINKIYDNAGDRLDIEALIMDIRNNGLYEFYPNENADAYAPVRVNVNVPQKYTDEYVEQLGREAFNEGKIEGEEIGYQKGFAEGSDDGYQDGYSEGLDDGAEEQKSLMVEATIRGNGVYEREDGYRKVTVDVTIPTFETEQLSVELTENGDYNYTPSKDGYDSVSVSVNVPTSEPADLRDLDIEITENKKYEITPTDYDGWKSVKLDVKVPTGGGGVDYSVLGWSSSFQSDLMNDLLNDIEETRVLKNRWEYAYNTSSQLEVVNLLQTKKHCPVVDMSRAKQYSYVKIHGSGTVYYPKQDFTPVPGFANNVTFDGCTSLEVIEPGQNWDLLNGSNFFRSCPKLKELPSDYCISSTRTSMQNHFYGCKSLTTIPEFDCSNIKSFDATFRDCENLSSISLLNTGKVTNMKYMFYNCRKLTSISELDCSSCTDMSDTFYGCKVLQSISLLNTGKVTNMSYLFYGCPGLVTIPELDCSSVTNMSWMLHPNSTTPALTNLGGFKNLGAKSTLTNSSGYFLDSQPNVTHDSLMNVINGLYDRKTAGYSVITLKFGSANLAKLTDEEKAIATNKGFTLTT